MQPSSGVTRTAKAVGTVERRAITVALVAAFLAIAVRAEAHAIGLSSGEYTAKGATLHVRLSFARGEIASLAPSLDADRDGHVSAAEVLAGRALLRDRLFGRVTVRADGGAACPPTLTDAALTEEDGLFVEGRFDCASASRGFAIDLAVLDDLANGHRHVARAVSGEAVHDEVLSRDHRTLSVSAPAPEKDGDGAAADRGAAPSGGWGFVAMGIEHILTGYDHLVFLLGLVLARGRVRSLLVAMTAFTIAHSITLALAALGVWAPSPRFVEPAIALSIVYVGIENFFVKDASKRWRITFPFGLIHGFGFAGALQDIALPRAEIPLALVSFNAGVEAGQLVVMGALLPLIFALRRRASSEPRVTRFLSGAVAVAGGIWFVSRIAFGG